ncbi:phosphotransferase [Burkholderiaceae bacterium FT117]|uniref:phosphotransferase family protein n=1 Tax=Zeimonas sediminis TaxID=2944268 RepID=UPI002342E142|nr:phosphotransferase [Zeimonas sediminis]MCM5569592.1 phosphotransferase [Zeimonas sediminis]
MNQAGTPGSGGLAAAAQAGGDDVAARISAFLAAHGLAEAGETVRCTPLEGGVSSDIWRVDTRRGTVCVKRALPRLKVAADWRAPTSRNAYEWAWIRFAARHVPQAVPEPLAHDPQAGLFAMAYLDPERHPVWKRQLLDGRVEPATARAVGEVLGRIHAASAHDPALAAEFPTLANFHALRLEPYLLATASRHPDLASRLESLAERTGAARIALVHGDVSPKNILVGPHGPVLLDAECAWYGDPAFDVAFCLNHLLLKALVRPDCRSALREAFSAFVEAYFAEARFEPRADLEGRAAALLPALMLARVDGKSPVEYLRDEPPRDTVRRFARPRIARAPAGLDEVARDWAGVDGALFDPPGPGRSR